MHRVTFEASALCACLLVGGIALILPLTQVTAADNKTELQQFGKNLNPNDSTATTLRGGCPTSPFPELLKKYTPGTQSSREGQNGILKLNPDFACRLSKLLARYPSVTINSAYRSKETQTILWNNALRKYGSAQAARKWVAPPGSSMHNKGLAADLGGATAALRTAAASEKLTFRMGHEPWHIEPLGAVSGNTPDGQSPPGTSGSKSLADAFRETTGIGQPPPGQQPPPPMQPPPPPQPLPQQQQPLQYFQQPLPVLNTGLITPPPTSGASTTSTGTQTAGLDDYYDPLLGKPSIADKLLGLAYNIAATSSEIATSVPIIVTDEDAAKLAGNPATETGTATSSLGSAKTLHPTETFVSGDITYPEYTSTQSRVTMLAWLADMRSRLVRALELLRPFGLRQIPFEAQPDEYSE